MNWTGEKPNKQQNSQTSKIFPQQKQLIGRLYPGMSICLLIDYQLLSAGKRVSTPLFPCMPASSEMYIHLTPSVQVEITQTQPVFLSSTCPAVHHNVKYNTSIV